MPNLSEILEGPGLPLNAADLGRMRREAFPQIIRDQIVNAAPGVEHVHIIITHSIALALAQDLDLAIEKDPSNSYCE